MKIADHRPETDERRWTLGSYVAAGFALFLFLYYLGESILTTSWPTDGWQMGGELTADPPTIFFEYNIFGGTTPIQAGDQLLAINGQPVEELLDARHAFFRLQSPDWPDGTRLQYTLLRADQTLTVETPVRRAAIWEYFGLYQYAQSGSWVQLAAGLFFFVISFIVFLLRPSSRAAHALLFIGMPFFFIGMPGNISAPALFYPEPPPSIPIDAWTLAINPSLMYLVLAFPRPKAPLRKHPHLTVALLYLTWPVAFNLAYLLNLDDRLGYLDAAFTIYPIQIALLMLVTAIALAHSAWKVRDPVGRSQFKWMLGGIFSFVFLGVGGWLVSAYLFPETMEGGNWLLTAIGWFLLPMSLAIAITRYRLFDIDVIIRKTLVYALLSGLLGLVYFGGVVVLQGLLPVENGQLSPIVVVVTTLVLAALFNPLRRRVQDFIDRRFYRRKYDGEKALADFASTARSEANLEALTAKLIDLVDETLQPTSRGLWLRLPQDLENKLEVIQTQQGNL